MPGCHRLLAAVATDLEVPRLAVGAIGSAGFAVTIDFVVTTDSVVTTELGSASQGFAASSGPVASWYLVATAVATDLDLAATQKRVACLGRSLDLVPVSLGFDPKTRVLDRSRDGHLHVSPCDQSQ